MDNVFFTADGRVSRIGFDPCAALVFTYGTNGLLENAELCCEEQSGFFMKHSNSNGVMAVWMKKNRTMDPASIAVSAKRYTAGIIAQEILGNRWADGRTYSFRLSSDHLLEYQLYLKRNGMKAWAAVRLSGRKPGEWTALPAGTHTKLTDALVKYLFGRKEGKQEKR